MPIGATQKVLNEIHLTHMCTDRLGKFTLWNQRKLDKQMFFSSCQCPLALFITALNGWLSINHHFLSLSSNPDMACFIQRDEIHCEKSKNIQ